MTPTQLAALLATVGLAALAQAIACTLLYRRVRALAARLDAPPAAPDAPGDPLRGVEARLARLEAGQIAREGGGAGDARRSRRLDRRQAAPADGPVLIAVPSLVAAPVPPATAAAAAELGRRFGGIWALADAGADADAIAREAGVPVGQVELILGLRALQPGAEPARGAADA